MAKRPAAKRRRITGTNRPLAICRADPPYRRMSPAGLVSACRSTRVCGPHAIVKKS